MKTLKVTPEIRQEIIEWYALKRAIGTYKTVAARHNICKQYVEKILREARSKQSTA
jgi:hypothetical protein